MDVQINLVTATHEITGTPGFLVQTYIGDTEPVSEFYDTLCEAEARLKLLESRRVSDQARTMYVGGRIIPINCDNFFRR